MPTAHPRSRLRGLTILLLVLLALPAAGAHADRAYTVPLPGRPTVVTSFDPPTRRWLPGHRGVDLSAVPGTPVLAAGSGRVRFVGDVAGRPVISIAHDSPADPAGLITTYEPVRASVPIGSTVVRGEVIGTVESGHPDCPAPGCLHWGARRGTGPTARYVNPLGLIGAVRIRLKPIGSSSTPPVGAPSAVTPVDGPADAPRAAARR
ncbi:M23 family metallopeptidase [Gordonia sp. ABSL1-1]|uniref:M23 family metallopeptidase n=1 Tax=Gordonia sp. ABSL1-1 TaxID=3053923 RepID=UPI00257365E5|nr:M23 family metallopeptidase [Gordonia sp. ABSL1-1]MDL9936252.1 M23 family metallopeptidase [Gordonia sp. ABSL1-1]